MILKNPVPFYFDADDTIFDTRGWFIKQAWDNGTSVHPSSLRLHPELSLPDHMLKREIQNGFLESAEFMDQTAMLPYAKHLLLALMAIGVPVEIVTHRGYHPKGKELTENLLAQYGLSNVKVHAVPTTVCKLKFCDELTGGKPFVLFDDNYDARKPQYEKIGSPLYDQLYCVTQPWNINPPEAFGATRDKCVARLAVEALINFCGVATISAAELLGAVKADATPAEHAAHAAREFYISAALRGHTTCN